ncbi:hypothetical protein TGAM01_v205100 [Trichoderma gamsii]|uniref:Uncharacterized protein n=1 Tax=Trichoderma gamsii TaxID=398673 RepID=A0A2P4ZPG5_9HYPO|nr:hypothetical protein TGAM01_v205100 [Trichoderma gamsii]PON26156.1 hypothetical protein TGAM01_v205100 [Trichoderma gamsii]
MAANNWGLKAAQPTASKRAAAAQADLSMSFPRCVMERSQFFSCAGVEHSMSQTRLLVIESATSELARRDTTDSE